MYIRVVAPQIEACYHPHMGSFTARLLEIRQLPGSHLAALIACPPGPVPAPGQYIQAHHPMESDSALATSLFLSGPHTHPSDGEHTHFLVSPIPASWRPGATLKLRGPLGHGFTLPPTLSRLALIALGDTSDRLLPLLPLAMQRGAAVALFSNDHPAHLPAAVEVNPLSALPDALPWADFIALDFPLHALPDLRAAFGLQPHTHLPCPTQALIYSPMPCAALAECTVCAVPAARRWKLACRHGPVFPLHQLDW